MMSKNIRISVFTIFAVFITIQTFAQEGIDLAIQRDRYVLNGEYEKAIEICGQIIKNTKFPYGKAYHYHERSLLKIKIKQYKSALADVNEAISLDDSVGTYFNTRGVIYRRLGNYQAALKDYNTVLSFYKIKDAYLNRGAVKIKLKDFKGALKDFNEAIARGEESATVYYNRGVAYKRLKNYAKAIKDFVGFP